MINFRKLILLLGVVFLILIISVLITFFIVKHLRVKEIVENEIEQSLGINVSIDKIDFSPLLTHIALRGITVHNPAGFPEDELAYIESVHFVFDPIEMLTQKKPIIYLFTLDLKRLNIVKNKEGKVNVEEIIPVKEDKTPFYFGVVVISVDDVKYTEYAGSGKKEHKYHIGLKQATFVGLKDESVVVKMVIYKAIENTNIGKLINLTIKPLASDLGNTVDAAWGTAKAGAKGVWDITTLPFKFIFGK